jgi:hypothetical protein
MAIVSLSDSFWQRVETLRCYDQGPCRPGAGGFRLLFRQQQGRLRFGEADETIQGQIEAIRDINKLEDLTERLVLVSSWAELLA